MKINFARKRIQKMDLGKDVPSWADTVLDFINSLGEQAISALTGGLTFADNFYAEYVDATFQHGVPAKVKLRRITVAKGSIALGAVGNAIDYVTVSPTANATDGSPQALVTVYFKNSGTARAALVLTSEGVTSGDRSVTIPAIVFPTPITPINVSDRRYWAIQPGRTNSLVSIGVDGAASFGTGPADAALTDRLALIFTTGAVAGNTAGFGPVTATVTKLAYLPKLSGYIRTQAAVANQRFYFGIQQGTGTNGTAFPAPGAPVASALTGAFIGYDLAVSANWLLVTGDGANASSVDTGVPVAASTFYTLILDCSVNGTVSGSVNGTKVSKTNNLPVAIFLQHLFQITTLAAAAINSPSFMYMRLEHN